MHRFFRKSERQNSKLFATDHSLPTRGWESWSGVRVLRILQFKTGILLVATACATVGALTIVPATWQLQEALKSAVAKEGLGVIGFHAAMSMIVQAIGAGIGLFGRYRSAHHAEAAALDVRRHLLEAALSERIEHTKGADRAEPQSTIVIDTERIDQFADQIIGNLLPGILLTLVGAIFVAANGPVLGSVSVIAGVPIFWLIILSSRRARISSVAYWAEHRMVLKRVLRILQARELISAHGAQARVVETELPYQVAFTKQANDLKRDIALSSMMQNVGFGVLAALLLVVSTIQLQNGTVNINQLFGSLFSLVMIQSGVRMTVNAQSSMAAGIPSLQRIEHQLKQHLQANGPGSPSLSGGLNFPSGGLNFPAAPLRIDTMSVTGLTHGFPTANTTDVPLLFQNLSVHIQQDDRLLLQGSNGSGKTTLLLILAGQLRPLHGTLELNGQPVPSFDLPPIRRNIAYVAQNVVLVDGSIEDNLRLLGDTATAGELETLLYDVGIAFPLHHQIGDEGQRLSGGQRQRLAIARALLHQPDLLLLDEPANHLDTDLISFLSNIEHRLKGTAVIIVSHGADLSSIGYRTLTL
jgi:ABC-type bacteriocin/lantibiotic exporter with double-glycine peptidase domain